MYGVKILDLSNPSAPEFIGSFSNVGETYGVHALGDRLFTADLVRGVSVLDISTPAGPVVIASDDNYNPHDLYSDGRYVYLADQDRHFVVLPLDLEEVN